MVNVPPNVPDEGRYSIGEAAIILGINRSTLLRHSELGYIKFGVRRNNARKFYVGREINRYWKAMY